MLVFASNNAKYGILRQYCDLLWSPLGLPEVMVVVSRLALASCLESNALGLWQCSFLLV